MPTALSVYGTSTASTSLTTANKFVTVTGGTGTNEPQKLGTATGYSEIYSQGTTNAWQSLGSIGSPSGNGFLWDVTTLEGQQIVAGTWNASTKMSVSTGSITADIYMRAYKWSSGSNTYTLIGTLSLTNQTLNTTLTIFTMSSASFSAMNFSTGDKLYCDIWFNVKTNSTSSTSTINLTVCTG